jgi:hypothetical protein
MNLIEDIISQIQQEFFEPILTQLLESKKFQEMKWLEN